MDKFDHYTRRVHNILMLLTMATVTIGLIAMAGFGILAAFASL